MVNLSPLGDTTQEASTSISGSEFTKGNLDGSNEWITAWACNEILGDENPIKIWAEDNENGWSTGRDWYEKYIKIKKIK